MRAILTFIDTDTENLICELSESTSPKMLTRDPATILRDCLNEAKRGTRGNRMRTKYIPLLRFVERCGTERIACGYVTTVGVL